MPITLIIQDIGDVFLTAAGTFLSILSKTKIYPSLFFQRFRQVSAPEGRGKPRSGRFPGRGFSIQKFSVFGALWLFMGNSPSLIT
jgi:hypothetical protein